MEIKEEEKTSNLKLKKSIKSLRKYIGNNIFPISVISTVFIVFFPWIVIDNKGFFGLVLNTKEYNNLGDFVGGITAPILGLVTIYLLYKAYKVQKQELEETKTALQEQSKTLTKQRFEDTFFQLLNIHKTNVDEIKIKELNISGRVCFKEFYDELRLITQVYELINKELKFPVESVQVSKFAYTVFFMGLDNTNKKHEEIYFKSDSIFKLFIYSKEMYFEGRTKAIEIEIDLLNNKGINEVFSNNITENDLFEKELKPHFLNGKHALLGHYYRHLIHIVRFTIEQNIEIYKDTKEAENQIKIYLRMLRSQLSNYEQIMLYYNGVWLDEKIWFGSGYFTDYKMIHNLPLELADFGIQPNDHPLIIKWKEKNKGKALFEVEE